MLRTMAVALMVLSTAWSAAASTPRAEHWQSDIDTLGSQLEKLHPNLYFQISRAQFTAELGRLKGEVETLSDQEIAFRLQTIVALVGDAHTMVDIRTNPNTRFPLRLEKFGDDLIVTRTTESSLAACGTKLLAIDGMDAAESFARAATLISHENDAWLAERVPPLLTRSEVLDFLGITAAKDRATFTFESGGGRFDVELEAVPSEPLAQTIDAPLPETAATPLYQRSPWKNYWWTWDESRHLMYVKYNSCAEDPAYPFATFAKAIFAAADRQRVDRFVVDIRNNTGGNSTVVQPLISGLKQRSWLRGRLFTIIGRQTFSAGVTAALDLISAGATLVGEPSGGKPNMYANVRSFVLPWSGLTVYYSSKYFRRIPDADPVWLEPTVRIDLTALDYFLQRDPVLEWIAPAPIEAPPVLAGRRRAVGRAGVTVGIGCGG